MYLTEKCRSRVVRYLGYEVENRDQVMRSRLGFAIPRVKTSLCHPSSKWVPFSIQERIIQRKERDGLRLLSAIPKILWASSPHCPTAVRLFDTFTFFISALCVQSSVVHILERTISAYSRSGGLPLGVPVLYDRLDISKILP